LVGVLILFVFEDSFGLFFDGGGGDVIIRLSVRISVTMILLLLLGPGGGWYLVLLSYRLLFSLAGSEWYASVTFYYSGVHLLCSWWFQ
jgi:hypothetical protein